MTQWDCGLHLALLQEVEKPEWKLEPCVQRTVTGRKCGRLLSAAAILDMI